MYKFYALLLFLPLVHACSLVATKEPTTPLTVSASQSLLFRQIKLAEPITFTFILGEELNSLETQNLFSIYFKDHKNASVPLTIRGSWNPCNNFLSYQIVTNINEFSHFNELNDIQPVNAAHDLTLEYLFKEDGKYLHKLSINDQSITFEMAKRIRNLEFSSTSNLTLDTTNLLFKKSVDKL